MNIGLLKEVKPEEYRVGLTPESAGEYIKKGHTVYVEKNAGIGARYSDTDYEETGCRITDRKTVFNKSDMIVKVKEPLQEEWEFFHEGQLLYTYLHLAANQELTEFLLRRRIAGIAYETIQESDGTLPVLKPMSEIAGRFSVQEGAKYLTNPYGGRGVLLGGVPGVSRGKVVILGAGIAGSNACKIARGMGADVTVLDISNEKLSYIDDIYEGSVDTLYASRTNIMESIRQADLVIGAVLIPGAAAPKLIKRDDLSSMKPGAVIVDIAVDQGGCVETSKPTFHSDPIFIIDSIVHYCVANMPGVVSVSSTRALTNVTNRYGLIIADKGIKEAVGFSPPIRMGLNTFDGHLTNKAVADTFQLPYKQSIF